MKKISKTTLTNNLNDNSLAFFQNARQIFLGAIDLPEYARAEFYAKKQIESGWEKNVFFTTLRQSYFYYKDRLNIKRHSLISSTGNQEIKIEDINILLDEETDGKQSGNVNKEILDDLFETITLAKRWFDPKPEYSAMQIFSFIEKTIQFISNNFNSQLTPKKIPYASGKKTIYSIKEGDFIEVYCFTRSYFIKDSTVFFDFERFKSNVRNLMLYSPHPENLQKVLKPYYEAALKNLRLWNEELYLLERNEEHKGKKIIKEDKQLQFEVDDLEIWNSNEDFNRFTKYNVKRYSNYDFAVFCNKVAGLINTELLVGKKAIPNATEPKAPLSLKDFFDINIDPRIIEQIQNAFKDYAGKKMAILIYLLQSKFKKIKIINNSKTQSRKHFVCALKIDQEITMQSINKVFQSGTDDLVIYETDADYIDIQEKLIKVFPK